MKKNISNHIDFKAVMVPLIIVATFFALLFNVSSLKLGAGLGREVHLLTNDISSEDDFIAFQKELKKDKIELSYSPTNSNRLLIKFVGVDDVEAFRKDMLIRFPSLHIYETGTFNSISTVTKTAKTIQSYFVVFLLIFITTWTYRYRLWGLYYSTAISTMSLLVIYISNIFGFTLDFKLWFTTLLLFVVLLLLKGWTIYNSNNAFDIPKIIHFHSIITLMLSVVSVFLFLLDRVFADSALAVGVVVILLFFETFYLNYVLVKIKEMMKTQNRFKNFFSKRDSIKVPDIVDSKVIIISLTFLIVVISILSLSNPSRKEKHNPDFSIENYLIVDNNDAVSFLEVQASLGKNNLSKNLLEYRISEEKKTWYVFDEFSNWHGLNITKYAVEDKLGVDVHVVRKSSFEYNFPTKYHVTFFIIFTLFNFSLLYFLSDRKSVSNFLEISLSMFAFLHLFRMIFNINTSFEFTIMQIFIPIFVLLSLLFFKEDENVIQTGGIGGVLGYSVTILSLLILPIVVIIPDPTPDHFYMISLFIIFGLSFISTFFLMFYISLFKEKNYDSIS